MFGPAREVMDEVFNQQEQALTAAWYARDTTELWRIWSSAVEEAMERAMGDTKFNKRDGVPQSSGMRGVSSSEARIEMMMSTPKCPGPTDFRAYEDGCKNLGRNGKACTHESGPGSWGLL